MSRDRLWDVEIYIKQHGSRGPRRSLGPLGPVRCRTEVEAVAIVLNDFRVYLLHEIYTGEPLLNPYLRFGATVPRKMRPIVKALKDGGHLLSQDGKPLTTNRKAKPKVTR